MRARAQNLRPALSTPAVSSSYLEVAVVVAQIRSNQAPHAAATAQQSARPVTISTSIKRVADAEDLALGMAKWREEQGTATETTAVFRDSAFENDVAKSNLAAILEQHGIKHVRSL